MRRKILPYNPKLKALASTLRKNSTLGEILLWTQLKGKQLGHDFDRQRPIGEFIVDFYCKDLMLAIEVDGDSHDDEWARRKDKVRQESLEAMGVTVLRFDDTEVRQNIDWVIEEIRNWIEWKRKDKAK
jgi:very-short-patch-repair endonuclease